MVTFNSTNFSPRGQTLGRADTLVFQKDCWENEVMRELDANLVMLNHVHMVPEGMISGKTLRQPRVGRLGVRAKTPGSPVTLQAYREDEFTMEFRRYQESSFSMEDVATLFADYNIRSEYTREVGYSLALDIDNWILGYRAVLRRLGQQVTAINGAGQNSPLNRAAILAAKLLMDKARVSQTERCWIFSPEQLISLLTIPEFTSGDFISGQPTMTGEIGQLYGYPVIINNNIVKNSSNGSTIVTGVEANGTRTLTQVATPGFAVAGSPNIVSPWFPDSQLNGDANSAGQHTELEITDSLPVGAYTGMLVRKDWLKFGFAQRPMTEVGREVTYLADVVVTSVLYDAKVYRAENAVLIHSYEAA